ncbi:MAG: hypothetical protein DHS20C16_32150 [Phycisphaerae bacterium]|nr:MAG: hypothetical protein DHS20C16_32150 [Phycisphaerae bacterium]
MTVMLAASFSQIVMGMALGFVCILLMMIILIQKGRGGGLASAFGGGGGGGGAFGAKTGDVFTGITVVLAFVFLLLTIFGNYVMRPEGINTAATTVRSSPSGTAPSVPVSGAGGAGANPVSVPVTIPTTDTTTDKPSADDDATATIPANDEDAAPSEDDVADDGADDGDEGDAGTEDTETTEDPSDDDAAGDDATGDDGEEGSPETP